MRLSLCVGEVGSSGSVAHSAAVRELAHAAGAVVDPISPALPTARRTSLSVETPSYVTAWLNGLLKKGSRLIEELTTGRSADTASGTQTGPSHIWRASLPEAVTSTAAAAHSRNLALFIRKWYNIPHSGGAPRNNAFKV